MANINYQDFYNDLSEDRQKLLYEADFEEASKLNNELEKRKKTNSSIIQSILDENKEQNNHIKPPVLEKTNFRVDSSNWKVVKQKEGFTFKVNEKGDILEYVDGNFVGEQKFTYEAALRETALAGKTMPSLDQFNAIIKSGKIITGTSLSGKSFGNGFISGYNVQNIYLSSDNGGLCINDDGTWCIMKSCENINAASVRCIDNNYFKTIRYTIQKKNL